MTQVGITLLLLFATVIADIWYIDQDGKRWGWFTKWSKPVKVAVFTSFGVIVLSFYLMISW